MKIGFKFLVGFLVVALFIGVVGFLSISISQNILHEEISSRLEVTVQSRADHIKSFLEGSVEKLRLVSGRLKLLSLLEDYNAVGREANKLEMKGILVDVKDSVGDFQEVFIIDLNGKVVASTNQVLDGLDYSSKEFFLAGRGREGLLLIKDEEENTVMYLSGPLSLNGDLLGVVVAEFNTQELFRILEDTTGLGETGEVYLVNKEGVMVSSSRFIEDTVLKQKVDTENANRCIQEHIAGDLSAEGVGNVISFKGYRDIQVMGSYKYIPLTEWCLLAEVDEDKAFAPIDRLRTSILTASLIIAVLAITLAVYLTYPILESVRKLAEGTEKVGKGDLECEIKVDSRDELGTLAKAFNEMTLNLKKITASRDELDKEVARREKAEHELELNQKLLKANVKELQDLYERVRKAEKK